MFSLRDLIDIVEGASAPPSWFRSGRPLTDDPAEFDDLHEAAQPVPSIPTVTFPMLWHVGSLDPSKKRNDSHEGAGLSVSLHPDAWRRIARGFVIGDTWRCAKPGNRFIAAHRLKRTQRAAIADWGVEQGLVAQQTNWRVSWFDDELDSKVSMDFADKKEAEDEAADRDVRPKPIQGGLVATPALRQRTMSKASPVMVPDLLLTAYAEEHSFDGVWWADRLDPAAYSA
jgi:hypothetical protein